MKYITASEVNRSFKAYELKSGSKADECNKKLSSAMKRVGEELLKKANDLYTK